jgi:5-methylthioadenosine/S-adenosylhomocysteine deaminase
MRTILYNGSIYPIPGQSVFLHNGYLIIEGNRINEVGMGEPRWNDDDYVINLHGGLVLPGLVNTHNHTPMSLLRGYADDLPLQEWLSEKMWPLEAKYIPEMTYWASLLSQVEMLKSGTTTFADMYDNMDRVAEGVVQSGMRAVLSRGVIGLCSREEQIRKLKEAVEFVSRWHGGAGGRITAMFSPHSAYTCPKDYLIQIIEKARELKLPIHTHLSETEREVEQTVREHGERTVHFLNRIGLFDGPTLVAHAVHVDESELDVLAEKDVKVSHNPISNLKLGSGIAPVPKMLKKGITVSLGTDSSASNNNLDLFEELRMVALLHKGVHQEPTLIPASQALEMATLGGARALFLENEIGSLETGKKADLIVLDIDQPHYTPTNNLLSHVVYAGRGSDVKHVMIDGRWVVWNREIITVDEEEILFEAERALQHLLERA